MKKVLSVLLALFLVTACSSANMYSHVSDENEVIFSGPNTSYTKADLYQSLKNNSVSAVTNDIFDRLAQTYPIDMEDLQKQADDFIDLYVSLGYESYLISYYGSLEAYREAYLANLVMGEMAKIYVDENYEKLKSEDLPVKMQVASFSTLEDAQACLHDAENGSTFDMAAVNNNCLSAPEESIYLDSDDTLAYEVKEYLNSTDSTGLSTIITNTASSTDADGNAVENNTYYLLNIISRNADDFKDEYVETAALAQTAETLYDYFLTTHKIQFFDQDLYKQMSEEYEVLK